MQLPKTDNVKTVDLRKKMIRVKVAGGLIVLALVLISALAVVLITMNYLTK